MLIAKLSTLVVAVLCAAVLCASAVPDDTLLKIQLKAENCQAAPSAVIEKQAAVWHQDILQKYIELCPVRKNDASPVALNVLIVRIDRMYDAQVFDDNLSINIPNPLILDVKNTIIGELPEGFPEDPPGKPRYTFTGWQNNFPATITVFEEGNSAINPGPAAYFLQWSATEHRFIIIERGAS